MPARVSPSLVASLILGLAPARAGGGQDYVHFEAAPVHPIRVTPDGTRLFVVNPPDNRLEVYDLSDPLEPLLIRTIPVGIAPVSVALRSNDEAWVVNSVSDTVSIVSVTAGRVVDTLYVKDEPADVCFAGTPERAFVTAAASDEVAVIDVASLVEIARVPIFGKDPRALAVAGDSVYVLVQRSGNGTTIVPEGTAPPQPPPSNGSLPPAPATGLIVAADDPAWSGVIGYTVPDIDLVELDANTLAVVRQVSGIGSTNYDLAVHPSTGDVWVVGTAARNLERFEDMLRGHAVDNQVAIVGPGRNPSITHVDLNPGVDYGILPNLAAMAVALTDPVSILIDAALGRVYVATQGVDRIAILDGAGAVVSRTEMSDATGSITQSRARRGTRGLAAHPAQPVIYVFNFLQDSIALFHTDPPLRGAEMRLGFDPTPSDLKLGRKYGYDAKLSGNGTQACSSCHVDGESDFLAWDLGQPGGELVPPPSSQPPPFDQAQNPVGDRHPMKGPLLTQSLRGLAGSGPYHWRGDRPTLESFNLSFAGILAGPLLVMGALEPTVLWLGSIAMPPNPNRAFDGSLATLPAGANQQAGLAAFVQDVGGTSCVQCHTPSSGGTNGMIIGSGFLQQSQPMKVAQLRNLYRRLGGGSGPRPVKSGFGFGHDGAAPTLAALFAGARFDPWSSDVKDDLAAYMLAFDTGTAPIVGWQVGVDADNAQSNRLTPKLALLEARSVAGDCDLVLKGTLDGAQIGMVYEPALSTWRADRGDLGPYTTQDLRDLAEVARAEWVLSAVPPGTGERSGVDRDSDGTRDGEEGLVAVGAPVAGCVPGPTLSGNLDPRIDTPRFALIVAGAPPASAGFLYLTQQPPVVLVASKPLVAIVPIVSDADGFVVHRLPLADDTALVGTGWRARAVFDDGCGGTTGTNELVVTIAP